MRISGFLDDFYLKKEIVVTDTGPFLFENVMTKKFDRLQFRQKAAIAAYPADLDDTTHSTYSIFHSLIY